MNGDHLAYRYEVREFLGAGSYGQVVKAYDHALGKLVAIKISKNLPKFHEQAMIEKQLLESIRSLESTATSNLIQLKDSFEFRKHICFVFDLLGSDLETVLSSKYRKGMSLDLIRNYSVQLVRALFALNQLDMIHTDIKPENILLESDSSDSEIKLIDFGSSYIQGQPHMSYIQTRFYRSPEAMLGLPFQPAMDMWSLGCVLAELYLGTPLFDGTDEPQMLEKIVATLGKPSPDLVARATRNRHVFDPISLLPFKTGFWRKIPGSAPLGVVLRNQKDFDEFEHHDFIDFVARCL